MSKARDLADLLADGLVSTAEVADGSIHTNKIANDAVTPAKLQSSGVFSIGGLNVDGEGTLSDAHYYAKYTNSEGISIVGTESQFELISHNSGDHAGSITIRDLNHGYALLNDFTQDAFVLRSFTASGDDFEIHSGGNNVSQLTQLVKFQDNGNVGIGSSTAAVTSKLHVDGTVNSTSSYNVSGTKVLDSNGVFIPQLSSNPSSPVDGQMYYNTTDDVVRHWDGTQWQTMTNKFTASGGTEADVTVGGTTYRVHEFTSSGTFTADTSGSVDLFIVAGGGGGGADNGAGGGAGGMIVQTNAAVNPGSYSIVIGGGGLGSIGDGNRVGNNGSNTTAFGYTAIGGGLAGSQSINGSSGGSGGGGSWDSSPGSGTLGQGYAGGNGGQYGTQGPGSGGGGAGGAGLASSSARRNGNGGPGFNIGTYVGTGFGDNGYLGGGGAGGCDNYEHEGFNVDSGYGLGGTGGGADIESTLSLRYRGRNGDANTGGGASGGAHDSAVAAGTRQYGGTGGSGIVIVRYIK